MQMTLGRLTVLGSLLVPLLAAGCVTPKRAFPVAALRSGCESSNIEVVKHDVHDLVLNVCGTYEDWRWHALNGWEYVGPSAEQPLAAPLDGDQDGVPDDVDACPALVGVASLDRTLNGCPPPLDSDSDGVADNQDGCPNVVGIPQPDPMRNGCPTDADGDGVADNQDGCPNVAGVPSDEPKRNGCPPDKDGDGVSDEVDGCPDVAGQASTDPARNGCPPDQDGDGVTDDQDACPEDAGETTVDAASNGCPEGKAPPPQAPTT
ncbi:MAG: thrombospondin type 3 repeat-containing protein [Deltaproteobacteria bacterium]|nr:thrombospondin type 3 repeat-containing protein [Deltaproteobacteria bacterium]